MRGIINFPKNPHFKCKIAKGSNTISPLSAWDTNEFDWDYTGTAFVHEAYRNTAPGTKFASSIF